MQLAMIGLGRMGGNMARRLSRAGHSVVGVDRDPAVAAQLEREDGIIPAATVAEAIGRLEAPRVLWLMLPAGEITEQTLKEVIPLLEPEDIVIDGGNAWYRDSMRRGQMLAEHGIRYADAGTSGGVWGLDNGYCMMVGADEAVFRVIEPVIRDLAPGVDRGWAHVGPVGAGHFTKMVHNGIEYGMMQAMAEGLAILRAKEEFALDLAEITEMWRHGSVVRSWLLDLTAEAFTQDQALADIAPVVADSGEGRWTVQEAVELGVAAPVIAGSLWTRFDSQDETAYGNRVLSIMRRAFGGHAITRAK
ncbi:MAG: decarboxylating 6-phosphogluconate dehydrogenase [Chromatiales bacterium]|nr:decarboxylating 6-phosphogluconate dehydrogenase [Chromatiales bacterium]